MRHLKLLSLIFLMALFSCGGDDNNPVIDEPDNPDPVQPANKYPTELVGTWQFYSGNPVAVLTSIEENNILNQTLIFVANGNMNEAIVHPKGDYQGEIVSANGNWLVDNQQLTITDWQGHTVVGNCYYKIYADSSLTLTIGGKSAVYYKQESIKKKYPDLIVSRWNSLRQDNGRERMTFNRDYSGIYETNYYNGFYNGRGIFTWSYNDNVITAKYKDRATSIATEEYAINYLNKKSISWTFKKDTVYYLREQ